MIKLILDRIKRNQAFSTDHIEALSRLHAAGILDFMHAKAQPQIIGLGNDVQVAATQAARSAGYFEALTDLLYFRELYIDVDKIKDIPRDYGGNQLAVDQGLLTKEELESVTTGKPFKYEPISTKPASK